MSRTIQLILAATVIAVGFALLAGSVVGPVCAAGDIPWGDPWQEQATVNLYTLINDGYEIAGGSFNVLPGGAIEIIYLKKGKHLYKCATVGFEAKGAPIHHSCQMLISPKKGQ